MTVVSIFILCYNEAPLIRDTILHYRRMHPHATITIYDNNSTDGSQDIAKSLGCNVISWDRGSEVSNIVRARIKNTCWKHVKEGWIIVCDMDEWACVLDDDLKIEEELGTTIINVEGKNMITPESTKNDLSDIDLHKVAYGNNYGSSKCLIFKAGFSDINYTAGAHRCSPKPESYIKYNTNKYYFKHYDLMCLPYYRNKMKKNFERTIEDRKIKLSVHYKKDDTDIDMQYTERTQNARSLLDLFEKYHPK